MKSAEVANNRINGLDEFDPIKTITVLSLPVVLNSVRWPKRQKRKKATDR
jgi:hypothetical protein